MTEKMYDVTIVGGGPVGMFAAFYCGLHELNAQLIEALPTLGGQPAALYPEKQIWDVAGKAGVTGRQLAADLAAQMAIAPVDTVVGQMVTNVQKDPDGCFTITTDQATYRAKAVLVALGKGAFTPRPLALPGAAELDDQQLSYFVTQKADFAGQDVVVLGGGDSAIDMALMLEPVAKSVKLVHRRDQFRALPKMVSDLQASAVEILTPYLPKAISSQADGKVSLTLKKMKSGEELTLTPDRVLVNYGFTSNNAALKDWQLDLASEHHLIQVDSTMQTSVAGVYAIGDGVTYPGKVALIANGFGEAPVAVTALAKALYPDKRLAMHSSSMKIKA
ncbi:MAG: NAD(P)/FAD-dependent oxidoreductase [Limosilactobacillus ingluviei]|nr:NAD(P)/FAD-dependent oxidoreductase [Limosilactobacillus ingluviei]